MSKIEIPFDSELQEQEIHIPEGFEASIEGGKIILRKVESEDERIRKDVLAFIRREGQHIEKYKWHKWLAWLEKQGEQNYDFHGIAESRPAKGKLKELCQEFSQSKVTKKSDQEWSEEDEEMLDNIIDDYDDAEEHNLVDDIGKVMWLKSLKERLSL